jgi:hypothetical protein
VLDAYEEPENRAKTVLAGAEVKLLGGTSVCVFCNLLIPSWRRSFESHSLRQFLSWRPQGQREPEHRSLADLAGDSYFAAVGFDHGPGDGQAHAGSLH